MSSPRFLISPTAFKKTLRPAEAARLLALVVRRHHPKSSITLLPIADGGDGTLDVFLATRRGRKIQTVVRGPQGKPVKALWGLFPGKIAVIEMARASGLALVRGANRIMFSDTFGTGQLIRAALDHGARDIRIGVGGTATGDGGAGALKALGLQYYDSAGQSLSGCPRDLMRLARVDAANLDPRLKRTRITVLCDVTNPLLGPTGSARTFGPQKGATPAQVRQLEKAMKTWSRFAPHSAVRRPGSGAAGALAFGLAGFLKANLTPGADAILNALGWDSAIRRADILISGEGQVDDTTLRGKAVGTALRRRRGKTVWLVCGKMALSERSLKAHGVKRWAEMGRAGLRNPKKALLIAAQRLFD